MRLTSLYSSTVAFLCPRSIKIQTAGNRFYHLHHSSRISGPKVNANTQNLVRIHYNNQYEYLIPSFRYYQARTMTSRHVTKGEEAEKMVKRSEDTSDSASTSSDEFKELGTESTSPKQEELQSKELGAAEKLKLAIRDYGGTVIVFHVTISLMSLGSCYVLVSRLNSTSFNKLTSWFDSFYTLYYTVDWMWWVSWSGLVWAKPTFRVKSHKVEVRSSYHMQSIKYSHLFD